MVANYTVFVAGTEQEVVEGLRDFLVNHVGWYFEWALANTVSDRHFVFASDGEPDRYPQNRNTRYIGFRGTADKLSFYTYKTFSSGIYTGEITHTNTDFTSLTGPMIITVIADKERVLLAAQTSSINCYAPAYIGRVISLYSDAQDPYPDVVRGDNSHLGEWHESETRTQWYAYTPSNTLRQYKITNHEDIAEAGGPNTRNQDFSSFNPMLYTDASVGDKELRGYLRGVYQVSNTLAHGSYLTLSSGIHLIYKGTEQDSAWAYGPLTDSRIGDPFEIPSYLPTVDYDYRGFITDSNTLAHWRFDGAVGGLYLSETDTYPLTPLNSPTVSGSHLTYAIDLNGSNQRLTSTGDATAATELNSSWTFCCAFVPDALPVSGAWTLVEYGFNSEGTNTENTLLSVAITSTGNVRVIWEQSGGTDVSSTTSVSGGFIKAGRYNYLFVVKTLNGPGWDLDIWHASFGDHSVVLRQSFPQLASSTGGSASNWYVGANSAGAEFFNGRIDEIQVQGTFMTEVELNNYLRRTKL